MKSYIKQGLALFLLALVLFTACNEDPYVETPLPVNESTEFEKLSSSPALGAYVNSVSDLLENQVKKGINLKQAQEEFSSIESQEDLDFKLQKYFDNPQKVSQDFKRLKKTKARLLESVSILNTLSDAKRQEVIENATRRYLKANVPTVNLRRGPCEEQREADIKACEDDGTIAAASCVLATPLLWGFGGIACGVGVILSYNSCENHANETYDICKRYDDSQNQY